MEVQLKTKIIDYEQAQSKECHRATPISICVGADETFFGLPILVAMELASGFIFSEVECENRTYETWWKEVSSQGNRMKINRLLVLCDTDSNAFAQK